MSDVIQFPSQDALLDFSVVQEILTDLSEAFPGGSRSKDIKSLVRVYRNNLARVSADAARGAVRAIVRNDERFPSVSRLRAAAHEWTKRNTASPEYQFRHDANRCPSCTHSFVTVTRWRPAKDGKGCFVVTPDRRSIVLEPYTRDVCGCHSACPYAPELSVDAHDGDGRATMPIALLPPIDQYWIAAQPLPPRLPSRAPALQNTIAADVQREARQLASGVSR